MFEIALIASKIILCKKLCNKIFLEEIKLAYILLHRNVSDIFL